MELEIEKNNEIVEINCSCGARIITPMMEEKGKINCPECEKELDI